VADEERGSLGARELIDDLLALTANTDVQVLHGNKTVEVRNAEIHKGIVSQRWLLNCGSDFILAIGDDLTDEDMFTVLPAGAHSIRVGNSPTQARYYLRGPDDVSMLLDALVKGEQLGECSHDTAPQALHG
jgi:trehalose 6-phosphate synthase/phosphatase